MAKGRATSVKPIEPARRRKETVPRSEAWLARVAAGKQARVAAALEDHAVFEPTELRADPVELLGRQGPSRVAELLPIRYGRMVSSPFAFYRGAALVMAADLATTPQLGASGAVMRRCAPVELRVLRLPGAASGVRPQRLRRDPAGAV